MDRLQIEGAPWEQGASFDAVAVAGASASDDEVARLIDPLLRAAADDEANEAIGVQRAPAARRALASLLCAIDDERFEAALEEVVFETTHTPFPPRDTTQGLILATDAGRCDQAELIAEVFSVFDRAHVPGFDSALKIISRSLPAREVVARRAVERHVALVLAAWLDLPDGEQTLRSRADDLVARAVAGSLGPEEILRSNDLGRLSRWASAELQEQVARDLIATLADHADIGVHRYEAGEGMAVLAPRLDPDVASRALDELFQHQDAVATPSSLEGGASHPNRAFARVVMDAPAESDWVRAVALRGACELAGRCGRVVEISEAVSWALRDEEPIIRSAAVRLCHRWTELPDADYAALLEDPDQSIQGQALAALAEEGSLAADCPALLESAAPGAGFSLRVAVLGLARDRASTHRAVLERLADDPHVYIRAAARQALAQP